MSKSQSRPMVLVAAAAVVLLAACAGSDDPTGDVASSTDPAPTTDAAVPTSEVVSGGSGASDSGPTTAPMTTDSVPTTDAPSTSDGAPTSDAPSTTETPSTTPTIPADTGECLVGSWVVDQEQMNTFYAGLMTTVDAPIAIAAVGAADLTFGDDDTYAWAPAFDLTVDVAGQPGVGATTGSVTGSWTAGDGVITTASEVNDLDVSITVNGTTFSGSDLANGLLNSSPVDGVTYSCAGPTPVLDFHTADPAVTIPVTLTPA